MNWSWYNGFDQKKPTISFLHGFLENSTTWLPFIKDISVHYNCLLIDFPKHNNSSIKRISFDNISQSFITILEQLGIVETHLICHSMGGYFGFYLKNLFPEKINKVILCNSTFHSDNSEQKLKRDKIVNILKRNFETFCKICFSKYKDGTEVMNNVVENKIKIALSQEPKLLIAYQNLIKSRPSFEAVYLSQPLDFFFTFGELDTDIPWKEILPKIKKRYYIFPNEKHILPLNSKEKWSNLILNILE